MESLWRFWLYWYSYALNNPLRFIDPSGYTYGPSDYEREVARGEHTYYNWEMSWKLGGNRTPFANAFEWGRTVGGYSYNWATGQYDNSYSGTSMSAYDYSSLVLPSYLQHSGASTFTNITNMGFVNGRFQFTSVPAPTRLISNMQMWYNPSTSTMLQYDKLANEFYVPHSNTLFSEYMQSLAATKDRGFVFGNPVSEIVTGTASAVSLVRAVRNFLKSPIIQSHYGGVKAKYSTSLGRLGIAGDVASLSMSTWNIRQDPSNPQYYFDAFSAGMGFIPVYGDLAAIFYAVYSNLLNSVVTNPDIQEYWEEHPGASVEFQISGIRSY